MEFKNKRPKHARGFHSVHNMHKIPYFYYIAKMKRISTLDQDCKLEHILTFCPISLNQGRTKWRYVSGAIL